MKLLRTNVFEHWCDSHLHLSEWNDPNVQVFLEKFVNTFEFISAYLFSWMFNNFSCDRNSVEIHWRILKALLQAASMKLNETYCACVRISFRSLHVLSWVSLHKITSFSISATDFVSLFLLFSSTFLFALVLPHHPFFGSSNLLLFLMHSMHL